MSPGRAVHNRLVGVDRPRSTTCATKRQAPPCLPCGSAVKSRGKSRATLAFRTFKQLHSAHQDLKQCRPANAVERQTGVG